MKIKPELEDVINTFIVFILGEQDKEQFGDLAKSLSLIREGTKHWQALVTIGIYAAFLSNQVEEDDVKSTLGKIIDFTLEPLEASLEQIVLKPNDEKSEDEKARLLFHTRFSLGLLLLIKGKFKPDLDIENKGISLLHNIAATKFTVLSLSDSTSHSGPGLVKYYPDMGKVKTLAALTLPFIYLYQDSLEYGEILFHITAALPYAEYWRTYLIKEAGDWFERWIEKCDEYDTAGEHDFPTLEWLDLFAIATKILSACEDADSSGAFPSECRKESAQYVAWKFGQIVGHFTLAENQWHEDPFRHFSQFSYITVDEAFEFDFGPEQTAEALNRVLSLLSEYSPLQDVTKMRERYVTLWNSSSSYSGLPLNEIGPHTDLYWAMKIGFLDKVLEGAQPTALAIHTTDQQVLIPNLETLKEVMTTIALRQIKQGQENEIILDRLPSGKREVRRFLEEKLHSIWKELPAKIVDTLTQAEMYYKSDINIDKAKVEFAKAVEASLNHCFVKPLIDFAKRKCQGQIEIYLPPPEGVERKSVAQIEKLSLWKWAYVLRTIGTSGLPLAPKDISEFMKSHLGASRLPDLRQLAQLLSRSQHYRAGSAHYQEAASLYDKEKWELEQLRNLVFGIEQPSIITNIFESFSKRPGK